MKYNGSVMLNNFVECSGGKVAICIWVVTHERQIIANMFSLTISLYSVF